MNKFFKALGKGYFSIASVHHYRFCSNYQFDETIFAISTGNTKAGVSVSLLIKLEETSFLLDN